MSFLQNAAMMNNALDHMDMVTGIPSSGGRLPVQALAKAMQRSHTLNNFNISQSQIGVLNTGSIERIDAAITLSKGSDSQLVGDQLKTLTDAVVQSEELSDDQKNEVLELTESLAEEIVGKRKPATIKAVMKAITEKVSSTTSLVGAADKLWDAIRDLFTGL
ncbi:hypothetical protein [Roseovarius sp. THAF27]|uniref:hypothetical protein n=1 Tax=Roseovarius sp. THAF27 TaxID=2587850 RepID=UPI00126894B9|nr:hypothetical protein [Roseovarius sp. THAF27]